ncbi:MAG: phosphoribosyltransferase family protein, partial [Candidatus Woesearchaeota archaeon]|nr:phosphoribosyltransferase family protein [Candidatus Woesearchaeota archaeon]
MEWEDLTKNVAKLCSKITFKPDVIVGIARGGIVPALLVAHSLGVQNYFMIKMKREGSERKILADVSMDLKGKKVLIVEDMLETGRSLEVARAYFDSLGAKTSTCCLYVMHKTNVRADFFLDTIDIIPKFPW